MSRYSIKQLRAISYAYSKKNEAERVALLEETGLFPVYKWQTVYKTKAGFIRSKGKRFEKAVINAYNKVNERIHQLIKCNQTTCYAYNEAIFDLNNICGVIYRFNIKAKI